MSLRLRRIALDGFRRFRDPIAIDGLTDGLNIIIEPNETGKSTLLEALRAAFFVRHSTRNQLAQSFAPHGASVGPQIQVAFEADGASWSVSKRFLRGASIEVSGPQGRAQGEDAEARLHKLLGSERDTSQKGDPASHGALGLLWVAQTEALSVTGPGAMVRDTVRATLEAEVGSIMGGTAFQQVRDRVEEQYGNYWTPTGQKRDRQNGVRERVEAAEAAVGEAASRLAALEASFSELDTARTRLKIVERDIADGGDAQTRRDLLDTRDVARAAAQIVATRRAQQEAATVRVRSLEELQQRHEDAVAAREAAEQKLAHVREQRAGLAEALLAAKQRATDTRGALAEARTHYQQARELLAAGEILQQAHRRETAAAAARHRHAELLDHERRYREAKALADTLIPAARIKALEGLDRVVTEAEAAVRVGATRITFSGSTAGITIDGVAMQPGDRMLTRTARIRFGDTELIVAPPAAAESAEERLADAQAKRRLALNELGLADLVAAKVRNEDAREAAAKLGAIEAWIQAATPADDVLDLAAGADALKLFVSGLADEQGEAADPPDTVALKQAAEAAGVAVGRAEGTYEGALGALQGAQDEDAPLVAVEAGARSELSQADGIIASIEGRPEFAALARNLPEAREQAAAAAVRLEEATQNAAMHDPAMIERKIDVIDARARTANDRRTSLEKEISRLEGTIESEGGKGLADRAAAVREEVEAAQAALHRITAEADTLKLLRTVLEEARNETAARFVGPVARRAKRHIERLLPGCELYFAEDLSLQSVIRGGVSEGCAHLSKGTQEQLAVLTRIAFADMLLEQGRPVSLILDDPLVYSDDARLDLMIEVLLEVAGRMQVILLTCRDRAFRHVPGARIALAS